ncbi:endonuclease/exonuclease/phosphatase family protein [Plantactinospora sp. B6F1]|uniref:endonuclease/exonuclease/phosphatase family protein n=1 Tax=Plantactinospora sp. B6F1 TaxID=3158971 RepID=UPI00102CA65B
MTTKVDYPQLEKLADEVRRAETAIDAGINTLRGSDSGVPTLNTTPKITGNRLTPSVSLSPAPTLFGNTEAGSACHGAHGWAKSVMIDVLVAFSGTLDSDRDRLNMAIALYRDADARSESRLKVDALLKANRNQLDVLSTHITLNHGDDKPQPGQINRLGQLLGNESQGNTVVGGDFNSVANDDSPSAQALRGYAGRGFDLGASTIHDGWGGTSATNRPIDHLLPRGVGAAGEAHRFDRQQSDHDGQLVDVRLPSW